MRYKLLLAGKNQTTIDDFFYTMTEDFECQTTSIRSEDIVSHISYFQPNAFVYCIAEETRENIMKLITALRQVGKQKVNLILIGDSEDCYEFLRMEPDMVSMTLLKPITASAIKSQLIKFLAEQERLAQEEKERQEQIEREKKNSVEARKQQEEENAIAEKIRRMQQEKEQREQKEHEQRVRERQESVSSGPKHVLVIDDDPRMLRLIKEELRDKYNVATAVSGRIAMNFLERKQTDLILLDYEMPEEDGPAVLEKLRANDKTRDIPVIFLTGINDKEKIQKVLAMKPQGYLLKPIECTKLIQTIRQVIG